MTLEWKIKLINDLIKENRYATIQDYLDAVKEISGVETAFGRQMAIERILLHHDQGQVISKVETLYKKAN